LDNLELCVLGLSESSGIGNHEPNISTNAAHPTSDRFSCKEDRHSIMIKTLPLVEAEMMAHWRILLNGLKLGSTRWKKNCMVS
jgi:hypothetical protein